MKEPCPEAEKTIPDRQDVLFIALPSATGPREVHLAGVNFSQRTRGTGRRIVKNVQEPG